MVICCLCTSDLKVVFVLMIWLSVLFLGKGVFRTEGFHVTFCLFCFLVRVVVLVWWVVWGVVYDVVFAFEYLVVVVLLVVELVF